MGKSDSFYIAEDVRLKDGKIHEIDEKMRTFPEPKKQKNNPQPIRGICRTNNLRLLNLQLF